MEQEGIDREKEMAVLDDRGTRSLPGWSNEIRLTYSSGDSTTPDMAVWGSNVHVVWSDIKDGHYEIYYKKSINNGTSWNSDIRLTFTSNNQLEPKITVNQNNIHVVWCCGESGEIYYINSTNNGDDWGSIIAWDWTSYPPSSLGDKIIEPDVIAWGNYVYIIACAHGPEDLIFKRSSDNGGSWTPWIFVYNLIMAPGIISIETDGNIIHVVYKYGHTSGQWLKAIESHDGGDTWINNHLIYLADTINNNEFLYWFATSMNGSNLHVVYTLELTNSGVYSTIYGKVRELDSGLWSVGVDVYDNHIVWEEEDENNYRQLFSNKYNQTTNYPSNSIWATLSGSGNIIHIIWVDDRDGNNELYYSQRGLFADLAVNNSNIQFDPLSPVLNGTIIFINATVLCYSNSTSNVEVKFYIGDPDTNNDLIPDPTAVEIGNDTIKINKDSSALASIPWLPPLVGTYNIYVWVDPNNNTQEYNYTNNLANITLEVIPGIFTLGLVEGWNLISIPLELSENNLISLFQPIQGQYDAVQWFNTTDTYDNWKHYHISKSSYLNDLKYINQYMGIWLHVTVPGGTTLTIIDNNIKTPQNVSIYPGWNLVGYPSLTSYNRTEGLNNLTFGTDVDSIWTYNATTQKWGELGESDFFEIGRGYWIHAENKCTWEVPL